MIRCIQHVCSTRSCQAGPEQAMSKSVAWFDRGVEAIQRIATIDLASFGLADRYLCPICIRGFHREDASAMTLEDAPPRRLGGRKVALTCPDCNHSAGFRLDSH